MLHFCRKFSSGVDGNQREFDLETRVITNGNIIIPDVLQLCTKQVGTGEVIK